jgi:hypothetical protein
MDRSQDLTGLTVQFLSSHRVIVLDGDGKPGQNLREQTAVTGCAQAHHGRFEDFERRIGTGLHATCERGGGAHMGGQWMVLPALRGAACDGGFGDLDHLVRPPPRQQYRDQRMQDQCLVGPFRAFPRFSREGLGFGEAPLAERDLCGKPVHEGARSPMGGEVFHAHAPGALEVALRLGMLAEHVEHAGQRRPQVDVAKRGAFRVRGHDGLGAAQRLQRLGKLVGLHVADGEVVPGSREVGMVLAQFRAAFLKILAAQAQSLGLPAGGVVDQGQCGLGGSHATRHGRRLRCGGEQIDRLDGQWFGRQRVAAVGQQGTLSYAA